MPNNPFDIVRTFEDVMAEYTGAPKAVAVDSGTAALFLCFQQIRKLRCEWFGQPQNQRGEVAGFTLSLPKRTFISVPTMAIHANAKIQWRHSEWKGAYPIPLVSKEQKVPLIWDSALRLRIDLFMDLALADLPYPNYGIAPTYVCLSFQYRKHLPIGRGGMILHNDSDEVDMWFRQMRFFGRSEVPATEDPGPTVLGWRHYMTPADAACGLSFMQHMSDSNGDLSVEYPDLSEYEIFKPYTFEG